MERVLLEKLYVRQGMSAHAIACKLGCSDNKINYWLQKHCIAKRSISEAVYLQQNPRGDPFTERKPESAEEWLLFGVGLGLYWGEGNKRNRFAVRLGNSDPDVVSTFVRFLERLYEVRKSKFRFGLQIFSDMEPQEALRFWTRALEVTPQQFGKIIVTPARGVGNNREKTKWGVVTVYVSNIKLRNVLVGEIEKLKTIR